MEGVSQAPGRILLVDDDPVVRLVVRRHLEDQGHEVVTAADGAGAMALGAVSRPDVILLDLELPDLHGFEVLDRLGADPWSFTVPVIVLTSHTDEAVVVEALQRGAHDYVVKPPSWPVLDARIAVATRVKRLQDKLRETNEQLVGLAQTDELTALPNRRQGVALLAAAADAGRAGRRPVVMKIDVDRFKLINDVYGHAAGDAVLRRLAGVMAQQLRRGDHVVRWGGDEFVALLHHAGDDDAAVVAERLRQAVATDPELDDLGGVSVSIGWAAWTGQADAEELLREADDAMYVAKRSGRDTVSRAQQQPAA